ncbi:MAG: hypothetical protein E7570_09420 [Ruminococcaceae bacterium]|nr:hypothetical protein [Oscillospiraceae bacterium]
MAKVSAQKQLSQALEELDKLKKFKYSDTSGLREQYNSALKDYNSYINNPEKYGYNQYINDVNSLFDSIINQREFSYDPKTDMLFQLYKNQYQNQGSRAMKNQMGVASALSGGYNSSAAQTSAQNAYQKYMDELSLKAGEAYHNALEMYKSNQQNLLDKYNTARDMNNSLNDAYWKNADIKSTGLDNAYNAYTDDRSFQYNKFSDNRDFYQNQGNNAQNQINWLKEYELNKKRYKGK